MTREEAKEALSVLKIYDNQWLREAIDMAIEALSADAEWIPCSEKLPEKEELVLVTVWNDVVIAWRNRYGGWESVEYMYEKGDVIAWMPLPKPYRGEQIDSNT